MPERTPGFATLAIHAGAQPDPTTGARATPIYQTTSFVFEDVDHAASLFGLQAFGNIYTRIGNPTNAVLEERVAALEGGTAGLAVASGHAAQVLVMHALMTPGDEFVASRRSSMAARSTSSTTPSRISAGTWCGPTPTTSRASSGRSRPRPRRSSSSRSPIRAASSPTSRRSPPSRAAPAFRSSSTTRWRRPICAGRSTHGADIVVHSLTKFLGGHGNSIGGLIVDGGTFNWSREGRYPMLSEPRPEYHGIVFARDLRQFRLRHRLPRAWPCATSARRCRRSTPS